MKAMVSTPVIPKIPMSVFAKALGGLPLTFEFSPVALAVVFSLVCIFFAVASVVLVYHWRRFPYEHQTLHRVERIYELVSIILLGIAVFGIFFM